MAESFLMLRCTAELSSGKMGGKPVQRAGRLVTVLPIAVGVPSRAVIQPDDGGTLFSVQIESVRITDQILERCHSHSDDILLCDLQERHGYHWIVVGILSMLAADADNENISDGRRAEFKRALEIIQDTSHKLSSIDLSDKPA